MFWAVFLQSVSYVSCSILYTSCTLPYLISTVNLSGRYYYYFSFIEEETKTQWHEIICLRTYTQKLVELKFKIWLSRKDLSPIHTRMQCRV